MERLGYSVKETAGTLGISDKTVRRLIQEGRIPAVRIGSRRLLVPRSAILRWLESGDAHNAR